MYYFGYCTWLDEAELAKYFPQAKYVCFAKAPNWKVEFRAAGDRRDRGWCHLSNVHSEAETTLGTSALGLVYEVDNAHLNDHFDDFDIIFLTVRGDDGVAYDCFTYVLSEPGVPMKPPTYYWRHVPEGLRAWKFPPEYIAAVEKVHAEAADCPDVDRPVPSPSPGRAAASR